MSIRFQFFQKNIDISRINVELFSVFITCEFLIKNSLRNQENTDVLRMKVKLISFLCKFLTIASSHFLSTQKC